MSTPALNPLVTKIRTAYPGAYDDMDDAALTKSVLAKYPQYSDLAAPPVPNPREQLQMQPSNTATALNPTRSVAGPGEASYVAQADRPSQDRMLAAAAVGAGGQVLPGAIASTLPFIRTAARSHPIATQMVASGVIGQARHIPVVGKLIPPYAEMLPFLLGEGKGSPEEGGAPIERDATRGNAPYAGEEIPEPPKPQTPVYRDATRQNVPYAGEQTATAKLPFVPKPSTPSPEPSAWPPEEPVGNIRRAKPDPRQDLIDDQGVQQDMRNYLDAQDRKVNAFVPVGRSKGDMNAEFNEAVKPNLPFLKKQAGTGAVDDLTPLLQKSVEAARKKKGPQ